MMYGDNINTIAEISAMGSLVNKQRNNKKEPDRKYYKLVSAANRNGLEELNKTVGTSLDIYTSAYMKNFSSIKWTQM